jgi:hypothetical protein
MENKYPIGRTEFIRKQAIDTLELTKGYTPEQRQVAGNTFNTMEELSGYILELTSESPTGPVWVKANEALPGFAKPVKWKSAKGDEVKGKWSITQMTYNGPDSLEGWEWLNEIAPVQPLTPGAPTETGTYFAIVKHHIHDRMEYVVLHFLKHKNEYHAIGHSMNRMVKGEEIVGWVDLKTNY